MAKRKSSAPATPTREVKADTNGVGDVATVLPALEAGETWDQRSERLQRELKAVRGVARKERTAARKAEALSTYSAIVETHALAIVDEITALDPEKVVKALSIQIRDNEVNVKRCVVSKPRSGS